LNEETKRVENQKLSLFHKKRLCIHVWVNASLFAGHMIMHRMNACTAGRECACGVKVGELTQVHKVPLRFDTRPLPHHCAWVYQAHSLLRPRGVAGGNRGLRMRSWGVLGWWNELEIVQGRRRMMRRKKKKAAYMSNEFIS
jgi:hypothetical protein